MQVTTFIDGKQPPMLLLYGDADTTVKYANLEKLEQRIKKKGGCVQSKIYHDVDHTGFLGALSSFNSNDTPVIQDIVKFFDSGTQITRSDLMCPPVKK
ncbi:MAG: alpha/beta hydrolase family protein [Methylocella sp.]